MQGVPKKTSGRSYSLEHPVARHFVWHCIEQAKCRPQAVQNKSWRVFLHCRNCLGPERITSGCRRMGVTLAVEKSCPASGLRFLAIGASEVYFCGDSGSSGRTQRVFKSLRSGLGRRFTLPYRGRELRFPSNKFFRYNC
jgi:hypothetical protein